MPINFPSTPSVNQVFQRWIWNGSSWVGYIEDIPYLPLTGGTLYNPGNLDIKGDLTAEGDTTLEKLEVKDESHLDGVHADGLVMSDITDATDGSSGTGISLTNLSTAYKAAITIGMPAASTTSRGVVVTCTNHDQHAFYTDGQVHAGELEVTDFKAWGSGEVANNLTVDDFVSVGNCATIYSQSSNVALNLCRSFGWTATGTETGYSLVHYNVGGVTGGVAFYKDDWWAGLRDDTTWAVSLSASISSAADCFIIHRDRTVLIPGTLELGGDPTDDMEAATKHYVDNEISDVKNLGFFAGSFDTHADLPGNTSALPNVTVNDFVTVRADETQAGATTSYVCTAIAANGDISWTYDLTYATDVTGKMDKVPAAVVGNAAVFAAGGQVADGGAAFLPRAGAVLSQNFNLENNWGYTLKLGNSSAMMEFGATGELYITCGSLFQVTGTPSLMGGAYLYGDTTFQNANIAVAGSGTTGPTARGNVTITSTNVQNGNLRLTGGAIGQGNLTVEYGDINVSRRNVYINNGTLSSMYLSSGWVNAGYYQRGAPTYSTSYYTYLGDGFQVRSIEFPDWTYGNGVYIGGSEPAALVFQPWYNYGGESISLQNMGSYAGVCAFVNRYQWWGTLYGSSPPSNQANPQIFSFGCRANGTSPFIIAYQYARKPGGGPWDAMSDVRTKTDVHEYDHGLRELLRLNPIVFRYNGRGRMHETGHSYVGLHAEEVRDVMPEMVYSVKGKLDYDDEETDILHLNGTPLPYAIINALKELTKRIESLEARIK